MSASSEAYYRLRREFAASHAQLSISHYVLGIGDRHLSNFMIDQHTGAVVGIDFGHAFGSATQVRRCCGLAIFRWGGGKSWGSEGWKSLAGSTGKVSVEIWGRSLPEADHFP